MTLPSQLKKLTKQQLIDLLQEVYTSSDEVSRLIDEALLAESPFQSEADFPLIISLERQIAKLETDNSFIDYRQSLKFCERLDSMLMDIDSLVREQDLNEALRLTERFLETSEAVIQRSDDSDGDIADVYHAAVDQWLDIAATIRGTSPQQQDWKSRIKNFFDNNDYGLFDGIIANSRFVLTLEELQQLAWQFEKDIRNALKNRQGMEYNSDATHASLGLESVAVALSNLEMFERSITLTSPEPNTLQLAHIIEFAINLQAYERANYWLNKPQWKQDPERKKLYHHTLLEAQGRLEDLKTSLLQDFFEAPGRANLEAVWPMTNARERKQITLTVESFAQQTDLNRGQLDKSLYMLLIIGQTNLAETLLIQYQNQLSGHYFGTLMNWLKQFDEQKHTLACVVLYRLLLNDLLERGNSKAYHHGGHYFNKLLKLDRIIDDYKNLPDAEAYIRHLQDQHGRKRSFWREADYPSRPQ